MTEHIALIPAKKDSSRCENKNWRPFVSDKNLVSYLISILPEDFFDRVILSTDKADVDSFERVTIHNRDKMLATTESPINDLISKIIDTYDLSKDSYIWLLNPTSPIRHNEDFYKIRDLVVREQYTSVVSASEINPFVWKDAEPLFDVGYPRRNTQSIEATYSVENGQFIVFNVGSFKKKQTWYGENSFVYKQKGVHSFIDIDTDDDFREAQLMLGREGGSETMKNETLSVEHVIKEPVGDHAKLLFNHFRRYDHAMRELAITDEDTVIDSSCGKGYGSFLISQKAKSVYGLDVNEAYLKSARSMFTADNCTFAQYDAYHDMLAVGKVHKVDKVVCIETYEHIPRDHIEAYVVKLLACLKPGGDMFLTVPLGNNEPCSYNEFHLNEPTIDCVYRMFGSRFRRIRFDIEEFTNSYGYQVKYCAATMSGKMERNNEI